MVHNKWADVCEHGRRVQIFHKSRHLRVKQHNRT